VSFNYICKHNFFPSFKWCFVNCTSYFCSVICHNGIQTQSWMSVKKRAYTSEDLVIWKKMTSIPKGLRFMLVRTRTGFLCSILIANLWWIQSYVIWGTSGIHKFLSSQHATTTITLTKDTIILSFQYLHHSHEFFTPCQIGRSMTKNQTRQDMSVVQNTSSST